MQQVKKGRSKGKTLAQMQEELEVILGRLEEEETDLEASFALYQEGMKLLKQCNDAVDRVEKQLLVLEEGGLEEEN